MNTPIPLWFFLLSVCAAAFLVYRVLTRPHKIAGAVVHKRIIQLNGLLPYENGEVVPFSEIRFELGLIMADTKGLPHVEFVFVDSDLYDSVEMGDIVELEN